jgi:hypothetical protein
MLTARTADRDYLARCEAVEQAADQLHPYRPIPDARLHQRQVEIARHGESIAAWDVHVLSVRLEDAKQMAIDEGLLGLAIVVEHAIRLLDEATSLYAFAGRDEAETDAAIAAATKRCHGLALDSQSQMPPWSSAAWVLS